ncbi:MAG TPA: RNA methyltransferase [Burkholderiaceae bacterium]|nr:RNA methyltransferase [Burkholderiaceae bacterium]
MSVVDIVSRDNPIVARVRRLARSPGAYRREGAVWLEGEHLCGAFLEHGGAAAQALVAASAWDAPALRAIAGCAARVARVPDALFAGVSGLESPAGIGFVVELPATPAVDPLQPSVVLDRVQDAGNVGSILRSAAAMGYAQIVALTGTAALWSPRVLRAGMGAHFGLRLVEGADGAALGALQMPLLATSSHADEALGDAVLPWPCAWVFGHEGQGIAEAVAARCSRTVRIDQPGGEESLNVAAAAAICLHAGRRR